MLTVNDCKGSRMIHVVEKLYTMRLNVKDLLPYISWKIHAENRSLNLKSYLTESDYVSHRRCRKWSLMTLSTDSGRERRPCRRPSDFCHGMRTIRCQLRLTAATSIYTSSTGILAEAHQITDRYCKTTGNQSLSAGDILSMYETPSVSSYRTIKP